MQDSQSWFPSTSLTGNIIISNVAAFDLICVGHLVMYNGVFIVLDGCISDSKCQSR
jgi:hypothetical protein